MIVANGPLPNAGSNLSLLMINVVKKEVRLLRTKVMNIEIAMIKAMKDCCQNSEIIRKIKKLMIRLSNAPMTICLKK